MQVLVGLAALCGPPAAAGAKRARGGDPEVVDLTHTDSDAEAQEAAAGGPRGRLPGPGAAGAETGVATAEAPRRRRRRTEAAPAMAASSASACEEQDVLIVSCSEGSGTLSAAPPRAGVLPAAGVRDPTLAGGGSAGACQDGAAALLPALRDALDEGEAKAQELKQLKRRLMVSLA